MLLRLACSQIRCVVKLRKRWGCRAPIASRMTSPLPVRSARISNVSNVPDRLRNAKRHRRERQQRARHPEHDAAEVAGFHGGFSGAVARGREAEPGLLGIRLIFGARFLEGGE